MKLLSNFRFLFMLVAASFMVVSCGEDLGDGTGGGGSTTPTTMSLTTVSESTVAIGDTFTVNIMATAGDNALNVLQVFEDGVSIADFSRIVYNNEQAVANPVLLIGDSKTSIDVDAKVAAHTEVGTRTYRFTVADDAGNEESRSVDITTVGTPPALTYNGPTTIELPGGVLNNVSLTAVKGSGSIASIGLAIDGVMDNFDDLSFAGVPCTSNPHLIGGDLAEGFENALLTFRSPATDGSYLYTVTVTDEFGLESSTQFQVDVATATPLETLNGVLFNAGGPAGTGGLDLDNGMSTGSSDMEAEVRDRGIDGDGNWLQEIAPANDSRLYLLQPGVDGVSENFTFANIDSKETLAAIVGTGTEVSSSGTVAVGAIFIVERAGAVYAFQVAEVNVIQADNSDNYVVNIVK